MKIFSNEEYPQGGLEWLILRSGIPTASELDALISPLWKIRTGEGVETYLAKKIAEKWQGGPLPHFEGSFAMEQGKILEEEARPWYSLEFDCEIQRVGFIKTDDGSFGCSPDGLLGENTGIEIKCPCAETHVKYLLAGELPKEYAAQVHGSMFATDREEWKFLSYRRNFPPFLLTVKRDEEIQKKIAQALYDFTEKLKFGILRMQEINAAPLIVKSEKQ